MRHHGSWFCAELLLLVSLISLLTTWAVAGPALDRCGLTLQALSAEDLDAIAEQTGYRVGVLVTKVAAGSEAAKAGIRATDILFALGPKGVDSPEAAEAALATQTGQIDVAGIHLGADGKSEIYQVKMAADGGAAPPPPAPRPAAPAAADQQALQAKLNALEAAYGAGVLTEEEYKRKKAELQAAATPPAPAMDEATRKRLDALDAAHEAGVLSDEEYGRKRTELLGAVGGEAPRPPAAASAGRTYSDPQGRFILGYPAGWECVPREDGAGADFRSGAMVLNIIALQGDGTADELLAAFAKPIRDQSRDYVEIARGVLPLGLGEGPMVEYTGVSPNGTDAHSRLCATAGGGLGIVLMLTGPKTEFAAADAVWCEMLRSLRRAGEPPATETVAVGAPDAPLPVVAGDPIWAYLDMLDFMRTEAWGKPVVTPAAERERIVQLLRAEDPAAYDGLCRALEPVPAVWAQLSQKWAAAAEPKRQEQREFWRNQLLQPLFLYPPPAETETFRGRNDRVVFEYPKGWVCAQTEDGDTQFLYLAPPETETSWDVVLNPAASPPGALFAVMPLPEELRKIEFVDGARMIAQQFVQVPGSSMSEVGVVNIEGGAIVTYRGTMPGDDAERFYWVGAVAYGSDQILAGRIGGPLAQADELAPAFAYVLMTMQLNPPTGDAYGGAMVDYYTSRLGNTVVSAGW